MKRNRSQKVPPPEKRICKKHGRPIKPAAWRNGYRSMGCSRCFNEQAQQPDVRARRERKWQREIILCRRCKRRRCGRAFYVHSGHRHCATCHKRYSNGKKRETVIAGERRGQRKRRAKPSYREQFNAYQLSWRRQKKIESMKF